MKKFALSALTLLLATAVLVPTAQAIGHSQVSTSEALSEGNSLVEVVRNNRHARQK
ncbi:MAG: hypothetical protein AAFQ63_09190 [Cyanobacteria bacterium J06621_11]